MSKSTIRLKLIGHCITKNDVTTLPKLYHMYGIMPVYRDTIPANAIPPFMLTTELRDNKLWVDVYEESNNNA